MDWIDVLAFADLPDRSPLGVRAGGLSVVLVRREDEVVALGDACPHLGAPLSAGRVDGSDRLVCSAHGWSFDVFAIPDNGELPGGCSVIPVRIRNGRIEIQAP